MIITTETVSLSPGETKAVPVIVFEIDILAFCKAE